MKTIFQTDVVEVVLADLPEAAHLIQQRQAEFRHEWIWAKPDGTHSHVLVFAPTTKFPYNPIMDKDPKRGRPNKLAFIERTYRKRRQPTSNYGSTRKTITDSVIISGRRYPSSVQYFETEDDLRAYMTKTYSNATPTQGLPV